MITAGSGGRLMLEHVIMQTSCWASTIENSWFKEAESTVLISTLPTTKVFTPFDAFTEESATLKSAESAWICLGSF
jgi:hypothetical protein